MTPEQFKRLDTLFAEAQHVPAAERSAWLDRACADDPLVRAEVEAMLSGQRDAHGQRTSEVLGEALAGAMSPPPPARIDLGEGFGPYKVLGIIGEGGFGVVYLAEQTGAVRRRVALKVLKPGMDSQQVVARFEAERQALALINHPNVAKVYDGGLTPPELGSRPYFAMEHVAGVPITEYCDTHKLSVRERLELMIQVCDAIQHAHTKGIIHRDIKPSNILVAIEERTGDAGAASQVPTPKVIDFGIAKAIARPLTDRTLYTEVGQLIGTPAYMSPEQAGTTGLDVDTRTDVYSLGVVLYELIVGALPFDPATLRAAGHNEILRIIREVDPPRPSTRLSSLGQESTQIAARRRTALDRLRSELRRELEWIPLKAMEKDRQRRYGSAADLARDIQNYLHNRPLLAGPPSRVYLARKFVRRNRGPVAAAAALSVALIAGVVGTSWGFASAIDQRNKAVAAGLREKTEKDNARAAETEAQKQRDEARRQAYSASLLAAESAFRMDEIAPARERLASAPSELRGWEWGHLSALADQSVATWETDGVPLGLRFSPAGDSIVASTGDGSVVRLNPASGDTIGPTRLAKGAGVRAISADGSTAASLWSNNQIKLWDTRSGKELATLTGHRRYIVAAEFSSDGQRLVTGSLDAQVIIWDQADGWKPQPVKMQDEVTGLAVSPDGHRVAVGLQGGRCLTWALGHESEPQRLPTLREGPTALAFSPDGTRLAVASGVQPEGAQADSSSGAAPTVSIWDVSSLAPRGAFRAAGGPVWSLVFSPDGTRLAVGGLDHLVEVWDVAALTPVRTLRGHSDRVESLRFDPTGRWLVSGSADGTVKLWDQDLPPASWAQAKGVQLYACNAVSPDGRIAALGTITNTLEVRDIATWGELFMLRRHKSAAVSAAFTADGRRLASGSIDGEAKIWDMRTGRELLTISAHPQRVSCVAFSADGRWLATGSFDGDAKVWNAATGELRATARQSGKWIEAVALTPDGSRLVMADSDSVSVRDAATGGLLHLIPSASMSHGDCCLSPDGALLAAGGYGRSVTLADTATGRTLRTFVGLGDGVWSVAFNGKGDRLAAACADGTVRLWEPRSGLDLATLRDPAFGVRDLQFVDQDRMLTGRQSGQESRLWCWDSAPPRTREAERRGVDAQRAAAAVTADRLHDQLGSWTAVSRHLAFDPALADPIRRAALDYVLTRSEPELSAARRAAADALRPFRERLIFCKDVVEALGRDNSLDALARAEAIEMTLDLGDPPAALNSLSRAIATDTRAPREQLDRALAAALAATAAEQKNRAYLNTLGLVYRRLQRPADALAALRLAMEVSNSTAAAGDPTDRALAALCLQALGRNAEAVAMLDEAVAAMRTPRFAGNEEARAAVLEAEQSLGASEGQTPPP